jgi:uncharacterized protein
VTEPGRPAPGVRVVFRWRKWDGSDHWQHDCVYLGSDAWGDWFGQRAGWRSTRPGRDFTAEQANVTLVPPSGDFAFTRNAHPHRTRTYIDLAWDLRWDADEPTGIDMDLDVVDRVEGGVYIDDRDEWDEHRVRYGYPLDIVEHLEALAVDLERRVRDAESPFDEETAQRWLARLDELTEDAA